MKNFFNSVYTGFKKIKFLVVNLTEVMQDLYSESHKTLLRETKTKWNESIHYVYELKDNIFIVSFIPRLTYSLNTS